MRMNEESPTDADESEREGQRKMARGEDGRKRPKLPLGVPLLLPLYLLGRLRTLLSPSRRSGFEILT